MTRRTTCTRPAGGFVFLDAIAGALLITVAFWAVVLVAVQERNLVNDLRRRAAMDTLLVEQLERVRAAGFEALRVGADQPVSLAGLDDRLRDVTCFLDVAPFAANKPGLLRVTVRLVWRPPMPPERTPVVRAQSTLIARRNYTG